MHKQQAQANFTALGGHESGISALLVPFILTLLLFFGAAGFGAWAFMQREDYKSNSDQKAAAAVSVAEDALTKKLQNDFGEQQKQPLKTYTSPAAYGSVVISYPRTWSAYVIEATTVGTSQGVNAYFHPDFVPNVQNDQSTSYAVRLQIVQRSYQEELKGFDSGVKQGKVKVTPYHAPNMPNVLGTRIDGFITDKKNGSMILLPLRDKTIKIWTEAQTFEGDFNNYILQNLTFVP